MVCRMKWLSACGTCTSNVQVWQVFLFVWMDLFHVCGVVCTLCVQTSVNDASSMNGNKTRVGFSFDSGRKENTKRYTMCRDVGSAWSEERAGPKIEYLAGGAAEGNLVGNRLPL